MAARPIEPNAVYTFAEAAALLRTCRKVLRCEVASGRLRVTGPTNKYRIRGQWLLDWIEAGHNPVANQTEAEG